MNVSILVDNPKSWIVSYVREFAKELQKKGYRAHYIENAAKMPQGDVAFFLGCENIIPKDVRAKNRYNLVVHESNLPKGKGWSPLTWQILEGKKEIKATLFEAADKVDAGDIYAQKMMRFKGNELVDELRAEQWRATKALALDFLERYPQVNGKAQKGKGSFFPRRTPKDSELDANESLAAQFDKLRVVDNERYPAFFTHRGRTYMLKIYPK